MPLYPLVTALLTTGASVGGTLSKDHSRKKRNNCMSINTIHNPHEPIFYIGILKMHKINFYFNKVRLVNKVNKVIMSKFKNNTENFQVKVQTLMLLIN